MKLSIAYGYEIQHIKNVVNQLGWSNRVGKLAGFLEK